jgi:uncharacterized protein (TIGR02246 family)
MSCGTPTDKRSHTSTRERTRPFDVEAAGDLGRRLAGIVPTERLPTLVSGELLRSTEPHATGLGTLSARSYRKRHARPEHAFALERGHRAVQDRAGPLAREDAMRSPLKAASTAVALIVLCPFSSGALVDPKEEVAAATSAWGQALGEDQPEKVLPFYSDDAVLWGTLSPTVRSNREALRDYFVTAFKVLPGLKVTFGDQLIRVYGNTAVNTGYYTFAYVKDGETKTLPARYSFTYVKNGERWFIVDHHSSAMPLPRDRSPVR